MIAGTIEKLEKRSFSLPDERRFFDKGQIEVFTAGDVIFGKATLQPGWRWSTCVKPVAKTDSCEHPHLTYHVSGRLHIKMDDGMEMDFGPGDVSCVPPGHDAWVVGNEPVVLIDISGAAREYAKRG